MRDATHRTGLRRPAGEQTASRRHHAGERGHGFREQRCAATSSTPSAQRSPLAGPSETARVGGRPKSRHVFTLEGPDGRQRDGAARSKGRGERASAAWLCAGRPERSCSKRRRSVPPLLIDFSLERRTAIASASGFRLRLAGGKTWLLAQGFEPHTFRLQCAHLDVGPLSRLTRGVMPRPWRAC